MMSKPVHPSLNRLLRTCFKGVKSSINLHRGKGSPVFIKASKPSSFVMAPGTWQVVKFQEEFLEDETYRRLTLRNTVTQDYIVWSINRDLGTSMAVTSVYTTSDGTLVISVDPTLNHHSGEPL